MGDPKDILIRVEKSSEGIEGLGDKIKKTVEADFQAEAIEIRRVEMVGPQVGKDLQWKALLAIFYSMLGIVVYVAWRSSLNGALLRLLPLHTMC